MTATVTQSIRAAEPADRRQVTNLLAAAYQGGDLASWLVPSEAVRARVLLRYSEILAEHALDRGHVDLIDGVAVAVWYEFGDNTIRLPDYERRMTQALGRRHLDTFGPLEAALQVHHPAGRPHHHLALLAVSPARQGHGYGSLLLRHRLKLLDGVGMPSYLVATGPRSQTLFRRYGYTSRPPFALGGDSSPLLYPMWRGPRPEPSSPRSAHGYPMTP